MRNWNALTHLVALLDVRNSQLHAFDTANAALLPLLEGEALSFFRMYEGA